MRNRLAALVPTLIVASAVLALPALADNRPHTDPPAHPESASGTEICGHVDEMKAARIALQENRREDALRHLKRARSILRACDASLAMEDEEDTPALSI